MSALSIAAAVIGFLAGVWVCAYLLWHYGDRAFDALFSRWWLAPLGMVAILALFFVPFALAVAFGEVVVRVL